MLQRVLCLGCNGVNDVDYKFCKYCGTVRCVSKENQSKRNQSSLMDQINERIRSLDKRLDTSNYSQQKCHVKTELGEFLATLDPPKDFFTALPDDLQKYLVFKERKGRTQMHSGNCNFRGQTGKKSCECPITLAAKSVDSLIGKLRAIFRDMGRSGKWNPVLLTGNPAASHVMKRHLQSVTLEQSCHEVVRKQAVPLMFDKLEKLCRYLTYQISREKDAHSKFLLLRDRTYFSVVCHSGDRGGDLGLLSSTRLYQLPRGEGVFVSQTVGKQFH